MLRFKRMMTFAAVAWLATPAVVANAGESAEPLVIGDTFTLDSKEHRAPPRHDRPDGESRRPRDCAARRRLGRVPRLHPRRAHAANPQSLSRDRRDRHRRRIARRIVRRGSFLLDPELFDTYIAFDPSLWWNNQALVAGAAEHLQSKSGLAAVLYLATGSDAGLEPALRQLISAVREHSGVRAYYEVMRNEMHATLYHPAALRAFRTVFEPSSRSDDAR